MLRRLGAEKLRVHIADHAVRVFLLGIFREGLVAGQIDAGPGVLGEGHAGEVVQKRGDRVLDLRGLCGVRQAAPVFLLLLVGDEGMDHAGAEHVGNGVKRIIGEPELDDQEAGCERPEVSQRAVFQILLRRMPQNRGERIARDQQEQQDLAEEHRVTEGERGIDAVAVHREEDRLKDVHEGEDRDHRGDHAAGVDHKTPESALFLQVSDEEAHPEQDADRHRDEIDRRVGKEQHGQLPALQEAPENIRDIVDQHGKQKLPVLFPGGPFKGVLRMEQNVVAFDQKDQNGKQSDRRIIHTLFPLNHGFDTYLFNNIMDRRRLPVRWHVKYDKKMKLHS